ncbi:MULTISPECIES: hypothetical protein [Romboutsia]|uniref:Prokaryotic membrane lipoprotein lipid attachment site profile n=2 Tax=Romboutsia TaxID=1501226 RepID=A0A2P2BR89_9FIRM|nr:MULTISPECIES: hypothetical protein [Romboutsia]MCH1960205.1 hypothetical protein [Romboutsia hominis]MCH1969360.1 hypothetical protein [Romboutsia hominis]MDB8791773.1 hypothetical protein [Romboutsia sp. 1001216sp1]MDB8794104.1 hypothetical protein [Romboutsia sp. 1001216sp1]MDB8796350.1 hypothetical protein [Romboutsia sp. 1001216sp1]
MNLRFINWYTQALGAIFGIMACVYAYLKGFICTYSNISVFFDTMNFFEIVSSYLLLPLCITTFILSIIKAYGTNKEHLNNNLDKLNLIFISLNVIIGFIGARIYFLIPALFILFNVFMENVFKEYKEIDSDDECTINNCLLSSNDMDLILMNTKKEIALELLLKNADIEFIVDITGLSKEEIIDIGENLN